MAGILWMYMLFQGTLGNKNRKKKNLNCGISPRSSKKQGNYKMGTSHPSLGKSQSFKFCSSKQNPPLIKLFRQQL